MMFIKKLRAWNQLVKFMLIHREKGISSFTVQTTGREMIVRPYAGLKTDEPKAQPEKLRQDYVWV